MELRPEVQIFAEAMEKVLQYNDFKGGWKEDSNGYFGNCIFERCRKLEIALVGDVTDTTRAREGCIHIANYAMMLFDNLSNKGEDINGERNT